MEGVGVGGRVYSPDCCSLPSMTSLQALNLFRPLLAVSMVLIVSCTGGSHDTGSATPGDTGGAAADNITYGDPDAVTEFVVRYPTRTDAPGSTHELVFAEGGDTLWFTGQNWDTVVEMTLDGEMTYHVMEEGSGPHGIAFDGLGRLWVSLEFSSTLVRLDEAGRVVESLDVAIHCDTCPTPLNPHPHGIAFGADGETLWYTGKSTGTMGRVGTDGVIQNFQIPTLGSVPIYAEAGPDGNLWFVELLGGKIGRVTDAGKIEDFPIPTRNARPIELAPEPGGDAMWFTEEAGNNIGRIDRNGNITEYPIPKTQENVILAGLTFDTDGNIWVQQYVDQNNPEPEGPDHIIKVDKVILDTEPEDAASVPMTYYEVPTRKTVFHRITQGPDGGIWFTELNADKIGRIKERR